MKHPRRRRGRHWRFLPIVALTVVALVAAPAAFASGSWTFASADHLSIQINWQTDNSQSAQYEVFTLTQPVASAQCGSNGPGQIGQPDASYAIVLGAAGFALTRRWWWRLVWAAYPGLVAYSVIATGNHFVLDFVAGAAALLVTPLVDRAAAWFAGRGAVGRRLRVHAGRQEGLA